MVVADILAQQFKQKISKFGGILSEKWPLEENHGAPAEIVSQDGEPPIVRQNSLGYQSSPNQPKCWAGADLRC
jgi:hypothetical protein